MSVTYLGNVEEKPSVTGGITTIIKNMQYQVDYPSEARHILLDANIPDVLSSYPESGFNNLLLKSVVPNQVSGDVKRGIWTVSLTYNNNTSDIDTLLYDRTLLPWERDPYAISYGSKSYTEDHTLAYKSTDKQFSPSKAVAHPVTGEVYYTTKETSHNLINFTYNLRNFEYKWKREFEGTVNKGEVTLLGNTFDAENLVILSLGVSKEYEYTTTGTLVDYYKVIVQIEDLGESYSNKLPLLGFLMDAGGTFDVCNVQLLNGKYGKFTRNTDLNIDSAVYIDKYYGKPAQADKTIDSDYYEDYPARFTKDWTTLALPTEE